MPIDEKPAVRIRHSRTESGAAEVTRDFTARVFLAAGTGAPYFFDSQGNDAP